MPAEGCPVHVSLLAIPDSLAASLTGVYDALNCFGDVRAVDDTAPDEPPFEVAVVGPEAAATLTASGLSIGPVKAVDAVPETDVVIVPSMMVPGARWATGRYPKLVEWLREQHDRGATLGSACSGVLLLAETGLLDGLEATIHWAFVDTFRSTFPDVRLRADRMLVASGDRGEFVMSGAAASWHDLVLHIVSRFAGPTAALALIKYLALEWHPDGQLPYVIFQAPDDHGDATILEAQRWLREHNSVASPVEEMVSRCKLAPRTFKRRFKKATGHTPISYVQQLRVQEAKRQLERTDDSVEQIAWRVGYEDPAYFRRLFKRLAGLPPGAYRRKFRSPLIKGRES